MSDTTTTSTIIIDRNEFEFLQDKNYLTEQDCEDIIGNKDLIDKFIGHTIRQIRFDMLNLQFKSKEEIELRIDTLMKLRKWLDKTLINYKQYKEQITKPKEEDKRSEEEKKQEEEIIKIKRQYKI